MTPGAHHVLDERGELDRAPGERDVARGDPRHVEEVVDEPRQVPGLPLDDALGARGRRVLSGNVAEEADRAADGAERVT
jgi:hypothetical protein